ncbi:Panacea domain-containing protein [Rhodovulum sp. PH10]|uniref:Panacea domain-containing protein n=1 Tax=Rhodovulum sp. PH10 TaxID=1187851 RepID=UPI00058CA343|nr:type II toxin-antitoxin system antitoxin SocA domain-containing protein [Rhodovulum sp. PH10]
MMSVSALAAAKAVCEMRGWTLSNLALQKILYIAHMFHLAMTGKPLINEEFEAWDYGPVVPEVYRRVRAFGSDPIRNVFHWEPALERDTTEYQALKAAADATNGMSPASLVAFTHSPKGAWSRCYKPNVRGITIPNELILDEYRARKSK